ncbi:hypothetical protein GCM10011428_52500 [Streptomyces violaceus]|uniref:hypothetical protein n=1 Tax=Streptomyces violaceus TaxID=1936 RepID=UPI0031EC1CF2
MWRGSPPPNALGITVTAALLLAGLRAGRLNSPHSVSVRVPQVLAELSRLVGAAVVATLAGAFAASRPDSPARASRPAFSP